MKLALILAGAVSLAACHGKNDVQTAASPDNRDTTAVTQVIDSTRTGPPGVSGRPSNGTVTLDSVTHDTSMVSTDTSMTKMAPTSAPQDTLGPRDATGTGTGGTEMSPDTSKSQ